MEIDAFDATKLLTEESEQGGVAALVAALVAERCVRDDGCGVCIGEIMAAFSGINAHRKT